MATPSTERATELSPRALADRIAQIAAERKAHDIRVLDLRDVVTYTDYLVICSGNTERQTKAILESIRRELKHGDALIPQRIEGDQEARWILIDYLDCIVHVFTEQARAFYRLDQLWGEVPAESVG
jgi:ribosome-associated protein